MKRIIFISDQFFPKTSADSEQIIASLSELGKLADVTLCSAFYKYNTPSSKEELESYYQDKVSFSLDFISHLFKNIRGIEKISFAYRSAIKSSKKSPDLVYTRNLPVLIAILLLTKLPVLLESFRPWPTRNFLAKWLFKRLADNDQLLGIVLHSDFAAQSFRKVGFLENQLIVAHNAVDLNKYERFEVKETRELYDLPLDKFIVSYSGRVSVKKGLMRVFNLAEAFPDILFLIIGSENEGAIERKAKRFPNVKVIGWQEKKSVFRLLCASDILYIPNSLQAREKALNTVLPLKTFLYKASGIPIIAPDIEDISEVLRDQKTAILVEPDNIKEEIEKLDILINDRQLRNEIGANAKNEMKDLTWEKRAHKILTFIKIRLKVFNN